MRPPDIPVGGAILGVVCNHADCQESAELYPVLILRHKRHANPAHTTYIDIKVPICRAHLPTFESVVQGGGWKTLCELVTTSGRPRPVRKFSELAFRRLGEAETTTLLTPETFVAPPAPEEDEEDTIQ